MKKIVDFEICDIVPYSNGIIFAKKEMLDDNRCKVTFYGYDIKRAKPIPVTKSVYQLNKFGNAFKAICDNIGDYISCDTAVMRNKDIAVVYPSGETGIFDKDGNSKWSGDLFYHDSPVQGRRSFNLVYRTGAKCNYKLLCYTQKIQFTYRRRFFNGF